MTPWLIVLAYVVPIIGTLATFRRKAVSFWSIGNSIRRIFPDDRFYRKIRRWVRAYTSWRQQNQIAAYLDLDHLNRLAGKIEYAFGHLRDHTFGVYMMLVTVWDFLKIMFGDVAFQDEYFKDLFFHGTFAVLSWASYRRHVTAGIQMTEFMRSNSHVHPQEFFDHYYRRLGPSATPIPPKAERVVDPLNISYRTDKKPTHSYWLLMRGIYDTAIFARSVYKALEIVGYEYGREVFDAMASLWGSRLLQIFRGRLLVEGVEKLNDLPGKVILFFNHKTHFDYVFNFFALSSAHTANGQKIRPRYMAAKDHFVDNAFIYSGIGIGKLIESVDMVFVDRKGKGKKAIEEACAKLAEKNIAISMYPQGTRAPANFGPRGERLDAGYYTTGTANSLKKDLGHLKKGCAYLALDAAIALREKNLPLHLVCVGIDGTATLAPKGSFKIQTEGTVKFTIGDIITLTPESVAGLEKPIEGLPETDDEKNYMERLDKILNDVDRGLKRALKLHEKLKNRFLNQIRNQQLTAGENFLKINHRLTQADREEDYIPFAILDRIYALPWKEQSLFLTELAQYLVEGRDLNDLRDRVTDQLFRHRGKELKALAQQEKMKKVS